MCSSIHSLDCLAAASFSTAAGDGALKSDNYAFALFVCGTAANQYFEGLKFRHSLSQRLHAAPTFAGQVGGPQYRHLSRVLVYRTRAFRFLSARVLDLTKNQTLERASLTDPNHTAQLSRFLDVPEGLSHIPLPSIHLSTLVRPLQSTTGAAQKHAFHAFQNSRPGRLAASITPHIGSSQDKLDWGPMTF